MNMKIQKFFLFAVIAIITFSCGETKQAASDSDSAKEAAADDHEWKIMDEYHAVMADAFHPFKDSANLVPAKENAKNLAEVANRWAESELPGKVNNEQMKAALTRLRSSSVSFEETVQTNNDQAIGDSLNHLHDLFHSVQDAWYHAGEHKGHSH